MVKRVRKGKDRFLKQVGSRIQEARKRTGLSQEGLALAAGLDRSYIGGVERGERNIAIINLKRIGDALGLSLSDLLDAT